MINNAFKDNDKNIVYVLKETRSCVEFKKTTISLLCSASKEILAQPSHYKLLMDVILTLAETT